MKFDPQGIANSEEEIEELKKKLSLNSKMRGEFEDFLKKWTEKYNFSELVYLSILCNMSNFVMLRDKFGCKKL